MLPVPCASCSWHWTWRWEPLGSFSLWPPQRGSWTDRPMAWPLPEARGTALRAAMATPQWPSGIRLGLQTLACIKPRGLQTVGRICLWGVWGGLRPPSLLHLQQFPHSQHLLYTCKVCSQTAALANNVSQFKIYILSVFSTGIQFTSRRMDAITKKKDYNQHGGRRGEARALAPCWWECRAAVGKLVGGVAFPQNINCRVTTEPNNFPGR